MATFYVPQEGDRVAFDHQHGEKVGVITNVELNGTHVIVDVLSTSLRTGKPTLESYRVRVANLRKKG